MALYVITGPPGAGKSTHVRNHAKPGDIRIDYDEIATTLAGEAEDNHTHTPAIKAVTKKARQAAIDEAIKHADAVNVWIIHSSPSEQLLQKYRNLGAEIITIDPGKDVVMSRVKRNRPPELLKVAASWYAQQRDTPGPKRKTAPKSREARGYGNPHKQQRAILLRRHKDGTPCWWCNQPMYKDPTRNWDGKPLAADHSNQAASAGGKADRLLCFTCNSQRRDGTNDHLRPAITGRHPSEPLPTEYNLTRGQRKETASASGFNFGGVTFG